MFGNYKHFAPMGRNLRIFVTSMKNHNRSWSLILLLCAFILTGYLSARANASAALQPQLRVVGTVADVNGGTLLGGDQLEYAFQVTNVGDDPATLIVLSNAIPSGTTYVPGSMWTDSVNHTDLAADDAAEHSALDNKITVRLGTLATALTGGTLLPGESTAFRFRVSVSATMAAGAAISNQASVSYSGANVTEPMTELSDSDTNAPGSQPHVVFINTPPPAIELIHGVSPGASQPPGTDITFTTTFTNTGGAPAQNFSIIGRVHANTSFKIGSANATVNTTGLGVVLQYSNDDGASFTYTPTSGGGGAPSGYDRNVTTVRFVFVGSLSPTAPDNNGAVSFAAQIQ